MDHRSEKLRAAFARSRAQTPAASAPRRLGPWLLESVIGSGSMSTIYLARPAEAGEQTARYAVKVLDTAWQEQAIAVAFFRREATVGRRVTHPHLVSVLSAQVAAPPYYLVMPLLTGRTAEERLAKGELFSLPHALWIARQTAEAAGALHRAGYLHGDVKPGNLMLSSEGHTTLLDLGFARELTETGSALDRPVVGTIHYLAPELLTSTTRANERSDLYSLGATLYELLAGRPPFRVHSLEELAEAQQRGDAPDLRSLAPQVPSAVADLVRRLLSRDPLRRPGRALQVVRELVALEINTLAERIPA
jgi:serine/threonine-protein kinase